ncbi:hypothetical protein HO173_010119 [Letharia columbiana]|uniref:Uncharacterized protein n=1 Tax=Letharia columbiana TaxID=112416 RepID=A0A8H6L137_9LECA|nr:uncharacterized protein HO173_010119 [Letharia columbiana]KAF6231587.1 hypothetical protein HO173_010119 [Letharia columbiana]
MIPGTHIAAEEHNKIVRHIVASTNEAAELTRRELCSYGTIGVHVLELLEPATAKQASTTPGKQKQEAAAHDKQQGIKQEPGEEDFFGENNGGGDLLSDGVGKQEQQHDGDEKEQSSGGNHGTGRLKMVAGYEGRVVAGIKQKDGAFFTPVQQASSSPTTNYQQFRQL